MSNRCNSYEMHVDISLLVPGVSWHKEETNIKHVCTIRWKQMVVGSILRLMKLYIAKAIPKILRNKDSFILIVGH